MFFKAYETSESGRTKVSQLHMIVTVFRKYHRISNFADTDPLLYALLSCESRVSVFHTFVRFLMAVLCSVSFDVL